MKKIIPSSSPFKLSASMNNLFFMLVFTFTVFILFRYIKTMEKDIKIITDKLLLLETQQQLMVSSSPPPQPIASNTVQPAFKGMEMGTGGDNIPSVQNETIGDKLTCPSRPPDDDTESKDESMTSDIMLKMVREIDDDDEQSKSKVENNYYRTSSIPDGVSTNVEKNENMTDLIENDGKSGEARGDAMGETSCDAMGETSGETSCETSGDIMGEAIEDVADEVVDFDIVMKTDYPQKSLNAAEMSTNSLMKKTNEELKKMLKDQGKSIKGTKHDLVRRLVVE
jgi:hypothetical protein